MYKKYKVFDLVKIADQITNFWDNTDIFKKSINNRPSYKQCVFYEGPPSANGAPGIHHILSRTIKDALCRYKTMSGYRVHRKAGWDCHGLPVELQVEKELGITKEDIGQKISIEQYNSHCRKAVMKHRREWEKLTKEIGYWLDLDDPYITMDNNYIESVWHLLKQLHEKNLLYKGYNIQPYSPAAGTALSTHELNQPNCYRIVTDTSITAQFKLLDTDNTYVLAWTTTPWTLPANAALAVGPNIEYVKVRTTNPYSHKEINVILAKTTLNKYFKPEYQSNTDNKNTILDKAPLPSQSKDTLTWCIEQTYKGEELIGLKYEQLLPYVNSSPNNFRIIGADFVTTDEGTGIVHIAPTFGADDMKAAKENDIEPITVIDKNGNQTPIVDKEGRFVNQITDFAGMYVKPSYAKDEADNKQDVDTLIAIKLKKSEKAFWIEKYQHTYPHCWRTDKPIIYYPMDSWFIKTTEYKNKLIELNEKINWYPSYIGSEGRFGNWLSNLVDWNLSRERFWGTPLPIWRTQDQKQEKCIGSVKELKQEIDKAIAAGYHQQQLSSDFDMHRPYIDNIILVSDTGEPMYREAAIVDVWFDSGAMPYAQLHYPFANKEIFQERYPADFIVEGIDQTRGWFFTLHTISTMLFDSVAFKNVLVNGLVLDKHGNKMSKRLNNSIDPFEILKHYGPDVLRWYMIRVNDPWENLKFDKEDLIKIQKRFFNTFYNTFNFFSLYAGIDNFKYTEPDVKLTNITDQWIISKLNTLIQSVKESYEKYDLTKAARNIENFVVDDLSNWYVRINRKRFWKSENNADKLAAYQTLYNCIINSAKLMAPIAPFYAEQIYQDLNEVTKIEEQISIHLSDIPTENLELINKNLELGMEQAQKISSLVHSLRKKHKIKVRQPLSRLMFSFNSPELLPHLESIKEIILDEVNVKECIHDDKQFENLVTKKAIPNFKKLGKQHGNLMPEIKHHIENLSQANIKKFEQEGAITINIKDKAITLSDEELTIVSNQIEGWAVMNEGELTVALDITNYPNLYREGLSRDIVNRIQNLRKTMGLDVQDKISLIIQKPTHDMKQAIEENTDYIKNEVQATQLILTEKITDPIEIEIDTYTLYVNVAKHQ
jgi:isoleucyl-tRNA synthetase